MSGKPAISVIIPTYGRPERLRYCLAALSAIDYPRDRFEVIVIDDGSRIPPSTVVAEFAKHVNVKLIQQRHAGPATARNLGAKSSCAEFLAFTDDDCAPTPTWLTTIEACLRATPNQLIAGRVINALPRNPYSSASQILIDYLVGYFNANFQSACFVTSNNIGIARRDFFEAGGFDNSFRNAAGEDREFGDRWKNLGRVVNFRPELVVEHAHELTLRRFWQQHFNYGRAAWSFHFSRLTRGSHVISLEPWTFYRDLVIYPFKQPQATRPLFLAALLILSQIANAFGFVSMRFAHATRLPLATG
jgi:glycosyltransferase involved in cell wall biosynthesis